MIKHTVSMTAHHPREPIEHGPTAPGGVQDRGDDLQRRCRIPVVRVPWTVGVPGRDSSQNEAQLAGRLYNDPTEHRSFEGFVVHMHLAWVYLLHAEFEREGIDYRNGRKVGRASRLDRSTAGQSAEASSGASTSGESIGSSRFEQTSISSSASSKVVYAWTWPTLPPTRTPADF
jgi:hypothetical protein